MTPELGGESVAVIITYDQEMRQAGDGCYYTQPAFMHYYGELDGHTKCADALDAQPGGDDLAAWCMAALSGVPRPPPVPQ